MTEVELKVIVNSDEAVQGLRKVAAEAKKLYDSFDNQQKERKELIDSEIRAEKKLGEQRTASLKTDDLEAYNKLLEESKHQLEQIENAEKKAQKESDSFMSSVKSWALGVASVTSVVNLLKNALMATTVGINAFNTAGAAAKQVMYNLVTGASSLTQGLGQVIKAQRELNALRLQEKVDLFNAKKLQIEYSRLLVAASDQTKNNTDRLNSYNLALQKYNQMIDEEMASAGRRKAAIRELLDAQKDDEKLKLEYADISAKILDLENQRWAGQKEIMSQRSGLEKQIHQQRIDAWHKEIELDNLKRDEDRKNADLKRDLDNELILYHLEGRERDLKAAELAYKKDLDMYKNNEQIKLLLSERYKLQVLEIEKGYLEKLKKEYERFQEMIYFNPLQQGGSEQLRPYKGTMPTDNSDEKDKNKERLDAMKDFAKEVYSFTQDLLDREAEDARRHREILDTRVSDLQSELETEVRLYEAGYSSNVGAKKKELSELKKQRENALKEEEKAIQKQRQMQMIAQGVNIFTSTTQILKSFTGLGPLGLPLAAAAITAMFSLIATTKKKTQETVMLARGGHGTVNGRLHSQGGEPFLNHVEVEAGEKWGVLSRSASRKYGKVFENMVDSFNKEKLPIPKAGININNVTVENTGPNQRLDAILQENRKANSRETVTEYSDKIVITKGSNKRVIRK